MAHRCRLLRRPCFLRRRRTPRATTDPSPPTSAPPHQTRRRTRLATRPKSPCPQTLRKKGSKKRLVVVAWKRVTRVLRRESKRGVPPGFALIVPLARNRPCELEMELDPELESAETTVTVAATFSETSCSGWSLV